MRIFCLSDFLIKVLIPISTSFIYSTLFYSTLSASVMLLVITLLQRIILLNFIFYFWMDLLLYFFVFFIRFLHFFSFTIFHALSFYRSFFYMNLIDYIYHPNHVQNNRFSFYQQNRFYHWI